MKRLLSRLSKRISDYIIKAKTMKRRISAKYVIPAAGDPIRNGIVTFGENGVVESIGESNGDPRTMKDVEYYDGVLVPGFVNTHSHLELSYMKGVIPMHTGLPGFVECIMDTKTTFPEDEQRKAIAAMDKLMWETGVQAIGDISNTPVSFETKKNSNIRYINYLEIFDVLFSYDYKEIMRQGEDLWKVAAQDYGLQAYITLHSPYGVSEKLFSAYAGMPHTERLSIHFMESADDDLLFDRRGKFWELYNRKGLEVDFIGKCCSTERVIKHIPSDRKVLLVHNTNVTDEIIDHMVAAYPDLSWALCPCSNYYIEQKLPPIPLLRSKGLNLTIGTDSLSSNTRLCMVSEMKMISENFSVPLEELVKWVTLNGAKALGFDKEIGSFESGKTPGAVLIEGISDDLKFVDAESRRLL